MAKRRSPFHVLYIRKIDVYSSDYIKNKQELGRVVHLLFIQTTIGSVSEMSRISAPLIAGM